MYVVGVIVIFEKIVIEIKFFFMLDLLKYYFY